MCEKNRAKEHIENKYEKQNQKGQLFFCLIFKPYYRFLSHFK